MTVRYRLLGKTNIKIPILGLGTWGIGGGYWHPDYSRDEYWIQLIKRAIELNLKLIDTAEMYGAGHAEELVGEAVKDFNRDEVIIVTKVWPTHLRYDDVIRAAKGSVMRLGTYIDIYLIHAPNPAVPLKETMKAMERLIDMGLCRFIGVSNFDVELLEEARTYLSKYDIVVDQVEYSLLNRGVERNLLPYCQKENIILMAYSPLARGQIVRDHRFKILQEIGKKYGKTGIQVALNWLICKDNVVAIPKTTRFDHLEEIAGALGWRLSTSDVELIGRVFKI